VYDPRTHQAHCLNSVAAHVFRRCDGRTSASGIARAVRHELGVAVGESWVRLALEQLDEAGLLRDRETREAAEQESRRELLREAGLGAAILLPAVVSSWSPRRRGRRHASRTVGPALRHSARRQRPRLLLHGDGGCTGRC
jgi:hypothetical protein